MSYAQIRFNKPEVQTLVSLLDSEMFAYKNYVVSQVENGDLAKAKSYASHLRDLEELRSIFAANLRMLEKVST